MFSRKESIFKHLQCYELIDSLIKETDQATEKTLEIFCKKFIQQNDIYKRQIEIEKEKLEMLETIISNEHNKSIFTLIGDDTKTDFISYKYLHDWKETYEKKNSSDNFMNSLIEEEKMLNELYELLNKINEILVDLEKSIIQDFLK